MPTATHCQRRSRYRKKSTSQLIAMRMPPAVSSSRFLGWRTTGRMRLYSRRMETITARNTADHRMRRPMMTHGETWGSVRK